ncbi:MAG: YcfL family protein [Campylobacteraceae bacterium]|nr:YcfL family protein [Campylobacteraceae bacterium]
MRKMFYFLAFLTLIFTGCADKTPQLQSPSSNIIFESDKLGKWFALQNVVSLKRDDNFMEIEVTGKNNSDDKEVLTYNIDWYDQNGFIIKTILTKRKIASVESGKSIIIHAVSPSANAVNYKIRFGVPTEDDELRDQNVNLREYRGE